MIINEKEIGIGFGLGGRPARFVEQLCREENQIMDGPIHPRQPENQSNAEIDGETDGKNVDDRDGECGAQAGGEDAPLMV